MISPKRVTIDGKNVVGVEIRTTNHAEAVSETAKIPALWARFFQVEGAIPNRIDPGVVLGTYTRYESDYQGEYSLVVGAEVGDPGNVPAGMTGLTIPPAQYVVFTAEGEMPLALIKTWMHIWQYFSVTSENQRAYTTDFERHEKDAKGRVEIYIAIK
jgi:predicted transcriptional regulator YdeE